MTIRQKYPIKIIFKATIVSAVFLIMFFLNSTLAAEKQEPIQFEIKKEELKSDSPFLNPEPRIDEKAAEIMKENGGEKNYEILLKQKRRCLSLPQGWWVTLLAAYVFLIIFNLSYEFKSSARLRWFWEAFYTVLALLAWFKLDQCRQFSWFAQSVILEGLIIYAFYLYYRGRSTSLPSQPPIEKEKTALLPFE